MLDGFTSFFGLDALELDVSEGQLVSSGVDFVSKLRRNS